MSFSEDDAVDWWALTLGDVTSLVTTGAAAGAAAGTAGAGGGAWSSVTGLGDLGEVAAAAVGAVGMVAEVLGVGAASTCSATNGGVVDMAGGVLDPEGMVSFLRLGDWGSYRYQKRSIKWALIYRWLSKVNYFPTEIEPFYDHYIEY